MRITRYTHSCLRLEHSGGVLVVDPGIWSEPQALVGADAVLVTHEHYDHVDSMRLAGLGVPVFAPADARVRRVGFTPVAAGERFAVAGFAVTAVGGRHATVLDGRPDCANLGYLVDDRLYHPGDSLFVPDRPVQILAVPMQGSWMSTAEAVGFVRVVGPGRSFGIHDGQLNERGVDAVNQWLAGVPGAGYRWVAPGGTV